jgi:hypothetical protein
MTASTEIRATLDCVRNTQCNEAEHTTAEAACSSSKSTLGESASTAIYSFKDTLLQCIYTLTKC